MHALMLIYQELAKQKQNKLKLPKAMERAGFSASMKSIISIIYLTYFKSRISQNSTIDAKLDEAWHGHRIKLTYGGGCFISFLPHPVKGKIF